MDLGLNLFNGGLEMKWIERFNKMMEKRHNIVAVELVDKNGEALVWFNAEKSDLPVIDKFLVEGGCKFGSEDSYVEYTDKTGLHRVKEETNDNFI